MLMLQAFISYTRAARKIFCEFNSAGEDILTAAGYDFFI
jgi:hypothetical protein